VLTGLLGIKVANARKITEIVSDSEMEEGKISKTLTKAQERKKKNEIKKIAEQAKQVLRRIPTYLVSETRDLADTSQMIDEGNPNTFKVIGLDTA
jgi:F420-0:gamma-glutamyl ligase